MNKQRLLILAKHLDKHVESSEFSLDSWKKTTSCGTVACACGHATSIPAFQEAGFRLELSMEEDFWKDYMPVYKGWHGWKAVTVFFEIERDVAYHLFASGYYEGSPTSQDVAARIEEYVKNGRPE